MKKLFRPQIKDPRCEPLEAFSRLFSRAPTFIQVGAHNGALMDPILPLIREYGWTGLRIEPVLEYYKELARLHEKDSGIVCVHGAVAARRGKRKLYRLATVRGEPAWQTCLGSFKRKVVEKHKEDIPGFNERLMSESVDCVTLSSLTKKHGLKTVDIFVIDTEGFDFEIIKEINFRRWQPLLILYEHVHLGVESKKCEKFLRQRGFDLISWGPDTLAIYKNWTRTP